MSMGELKDILSHFENTAESRGLELRLSLSEIVLRKLDELRWSQKDLAERAGMKESFISRIVHSSTNCTFDTAGKLLFALGVTARIREHHQERAVLKFSRGGVEKQKISYKCEEKNVSSTPIRIQKTAGTGTQVATGAA